MTTEIPWATMCERAWRAREKAVLVLSKTAVGCAVYSRRGETYSGANIEHPWAPIIHSEVNALSTMAVDGETNLVAIVVVAERELFTPCGNCLDWIFFFGGPDCQVGFQGRPREKLKLWTAHDLMPHYPR